MTAEQMMVQSMVNIQFEQAKKMFKEIPLNIGDIMKKNPRELQCLGFNLVDLDVSFRKSQMQFSTYFKPVEREDQEICSKFRDELAKGPKKIMDQWNDKSSSSPFNEIARGLKDVQDKVEKEDSNKEDNEKVASHDEL